MQPQPQSRPTLTIVVPALNEQEAIGATVERCLKARDHIAATGGVGDVQIVVVSDGSTDRTEEIALGFDEVDVLAFDGNRGYGAAIKCGFEHGRGDLLAFLDADGTCDPRFFGPLCSAVLRDGADVALGSRMTADSQMPRIRAVGNFLFAALLGLLSQARVRDSASGMRVLRREALADLYPLPDGLQFTPAMSARVLLEGKLRLQELPMSYSERTGRSKLSTGRDGLRFLWSIVEAALCYRPARPLLLVAGAAALGGLVVGVGPVAFYLENGRLGEWMIYRILVASLLITMSTQVVCAAAVAEAIAATAHRRGISSIGITGNLARIFTRRARFIVSSALIAASIVLVAPGVWQYVTTGHVEMHWSRAVLASLLLVITTSFAAASFLVSMMELIRARRDFEPESRPPDRARPSRPRR